MESVCAKWLASQDTHKRNREDCQDFDGEGFLPLRTDSAETSNPSRKAGWPCSIPFLEAGRI